jgi:16S rRNA (cytosine967-C5)-methyltransferase
MASSARVRAVEILREVLERGGRATALLAEEPPGRSAEDADLVRQIVFGVLRNRSRLDEELSSACRVPLLSLSSDLREILEVALYQVRHLDRVPAYAAVNEAVGHAKSSGGQGAANLVNAVLRNLLRRHPLPRGEERGEGSTKAERLASLFSHPRFLVARWLARFGGETTLRILEADNAASGVDLMTNSRKTGREALAAALLAEGVTTRASPLTPLALTVVSGNPLRSPLFPAGHFSVQDLASQALPLLLPGGEILVDLAAAPGGKTFAALLLGQAVRVLALDRSIRRLGLLRENGVRLGIPEALAVAGDFLAPPLPAGRFDRLILDAPCSGTGTLRKNPEIRYRVTPDAIERLSRVQEQALESAAGLLAPGGFLLYATCSLEEEENERVVERSEDLARAPMEVATALRPFVSGDRFQILPAADNDGFTAHLLRRVKAPGDSEGSGSHG